MRTSLCIYIPWFPFSLRLLPPQEPTHVLTPFSPLLHSITRRLTLLQLPALLLMIIPLPINLLTPLATILGFLARRTLEQSLRAALRLLPIAHLTALAIGILVDHRATKLEDVFTEHRMLLALLPRVRRLDHFVQSARCLVKNEVARHGGVAENILHRFVEAIGEGPDQAERCNRGYAQQSPTCGRPCSCCWQACCRFAAGWVPWPGARRVFGAGTGDWMHTRARGRAHLLVVTPL